MNLRRGECLIGFGKVKDPIKKSHARLAGSAAHFFHLLIVLLLAAATVHAGSYCDLGAWRAKTSKAHSCCAGPDKKSPAPAGRSECCALAVAPIPAAAIAPAKPLAEIQPAFWPVADTLRVEPRIFLLPSPHPPPDPAHFVAFVLRRSLQAHAPPSFVA